MNWVTKKLGELLKIQNGYAFDSKLFSPEGLMPLIRIRDIKKGTETETGYSGDYDEKYIVKKGDLLIGMDGEFGCYEWKSDNALLNQRVCRLENFENQIYPRFLLYGINSYLKAIERVTGFTTVKHISSKQIANIEFPVPPLQIQQKIVVKLDKIFAEIDKATAAAEANVKNAEALFQNYLTGIFQSENSNFITKPIGEIGEIISGSGFPISEQGLLNEEIPFYKVSDMNLTGNENRMIFHNNSISRETAKKLGAKIIPPKSIIFPKIGGAIATNKKRVLTLPSCVDNNVMGIVPNEKLVKYEFFFHLISSIELSSLANEASLPSIKKSTVEERLVKIPQSLSEQEKVCKLLESLKNNSLSLRNGYMRKLNDLSSLKQSILKQAFNGELIKAA